MSIDRNRKYRFSSGTFVTNKINPDLDVNEAIEAPLNEFRRAPESTQMDTVASRDLEAAAREAKMKASKENGGDGMNVEYLRHVSAAQHNQITMASAGDKIKEMKTNMNEEILKTSQDEAVTEILTETANDNIVYKNYDMSDLDKYMENIDSMTLFESISLKNSVLRELNRLESCHTMIKAVDELRDNFDFVEPGKEPTMLDRKNAGTNADKKVLTANYLDSFGYNESAEEFTELYSLYQPKLNKLTEKLNERIKECSAYAGSTKYLTENFLQIIEKKLNNLDMNSLNANATKKSILILKDAFTNRCNLTYLMNKMSIFTKNKNHMKAIVKAFNGTFSDVASKMNKSFATKTMHSFITMLDRMFRGDIYKSLTFIYFLNYICATEAQSNNIAWVKVLVLNLSDIETGIWDIDTMTAEEYTRTVQYTFEPYLDQIILYINNRNVKLSSSIQAQYGVLLNWVEPKEDDSAEDHSEVTTTEADIDDIEHVDAEIVDAHIQTEVTNVVDVNYTEV